MGLKRRANGAGGQPGALRTILAPCVLSLSEVLGKAVDSEIVIRAVKMLGANLVLDAERDWLTGAIEAHHKGIDAILTFDDPQEPSSATTARVSYLRLFGVEYCQGKAIEPFAGEISNTLSFPLDRSVVRQTLGAPHRERADARVIDIYIAGELEIGFVYPRSKEHVAFVEIRLSTKGPKGGRS